MTWTRVLLLAWAVLFAWSERWQFHPPRYWLVVRSIEVHDAERGACPRMSVDRAVRHPFQGQWTVNIQRPTSDGWTTLPPIYRDVYPYDPDTALPEDLDLKWWVADPRPDAEAAVCNLPPGRYRLRTTWAITRPDGSVARLEGPSAEFTVR